MSINKSITDRELVLELCQGLKLRKREPSDLYGPGIYFEYQYKIEIITKGDYFGIPIVFVFGKNGMFTSA